MTIDAISNILSGIAIILCVLECRDLRKEINRLKDKEESQ